jgi:integrase
MRLTELTIDRLRPPDKGQKTYFDDVVKGLGVRISQGGAKSFVVMYGDKRQLKTLGRHPDKTLKEARTDAIAFLAGPKPISGKTTAEEALNAFLAHCGQHTSPRTKSDYERLLNRHFPKGRMSSITRQTLLTKLSGLSATPAEQSHASTAFNVFLNWCVAHGQIQGNPIAGIRGIGRIKQRERILTDEELKEIYQKAAGYGHPFGNIVRLCILTGQRRSEVANFRWSWIGEETITIPAAFTKNRREHTFPYGHMTKAVLAEMATDGDLLFKGRGDNIWNGWSKTKRDFNPLKAQWQLHDLRRTFASRHAEIGTPVHIVEKLLNHVSGTFSGVTGVYNRHSYLPEMTLACEAYENYLQSILPEA